MYQILEIVKSDKFIKQVVERVNQVNQIDTSALNHDIAYKPQQFEEVQIKLDNLIKTLEDNPDLRLFLKIRFISMKTNSMTSQIKSINLSNNKMPPKQYMTLVRLRIYYVIYSKI